MWFFRFRKRHSCSCRVIEITTPDSQKITRLRGELARLRDQNDTLRREVSLLRTCSHLYNEEMRSEVAAIWHRAERDLAFWRRRALMRDRQTHERELQLAHEPTLR